MRKRILFVVNPNAGVGAKSDLQALLDLHLNKVIFEPEVYLWQNVDALDRDVQKHLRSGIEAIVAVGGDGTFNRVVNAAYPRIRQFGLIPTGSGNGLARCLGIPRDFKEALALLNRNEERALDLGKFNDRYFVNVAGLGFDAQVATRFEENGRRGLKGYVRATLQTYRNAREFSFETEINGQRELRKALILGIANGSQWGNDLYLSRSSEPDDGQLELVQIHKPILADVPFLLRALRSGGRHKRIRIESWSGIRIKLPKPVAYHLDGEIGTVSGELFIECVPAAISLMN